MPAPNVANRGADFLIGLHEQCVGCLSVTCRSSLHLWSLLAEAYCPIQLVGNILGAVELGHGHRGPGTDLSKFAPQYLGQREQICCDVLVAVGTFEVTSRGRWQQSALDQQCDLGQENVTDFRVIAELPVASEKPTRVVVGLPVASENE